MPPSGVKSHLLEAPSAYLNSIGYADQCPPAFARFAGLGRLQPTNASGWNSWRGFVFVCSDSSRSTGDMRRFSQHLVSDLDPLK